MPETIAQLISAGAAGIMVVAFWIFTKNQREQNDAFMRHLAEERSHRERMAERCHEHATLESEKTRAVVDRSTAQNEKHALVLGEVSTHLSACAEQTKQLERTMRLRSANGGQSS